jgi:hypothetical protein
MTTTPLQRFLEKNSIVPASPLPLVHTADSYLIRKAVASGELHTSPCDIFEGEELLYFFVGRAAYKKTLREEPEHWELPSCLVFSFDVRGAKRAFPFDTGAFSRRRYPNYITMMDMADYQIRPTSIESAIGAFFQSNRNYYRLQGIERTKLISEHSVKVDDEEILALHTLIRERSARADDRRFSVEVQFDDVFSLKDRKLLLAIVPEIYLESPKYMRDIRRLGARVETYPMYPLRREYHYYAIYEKLDAFYKNGGHYEV